MGQGVRVMSVELKCIVEAALFAANNPLTILELKALFTDDEGVSKTQVLAVIDELQVEYANKSIELVYTAGGYRFQVKSKYSPWVTRLWQEKPVKYSRALLETLAIIAYQQPVTRGEIEEFRGVAVSSLIMRTLQERGWVRISGHKEVPGRPALYKTTDAFLDYFNLCTLDELPSLSSLRVDLSS